MYDTESNTVFRFIAKLSQLIALSFVSEILVLKLITWNCGGISAKHKIFLEKSEARGNTGKIFWPKIFYWSFTWRRKCDESQVNYDSDLKYGASNHCNKSAKLKLSVPLHPYTDQPFIIIHR